MLNPKKITTFKAFQSRNYSLYFSGQSVSLIGTWMQRTGVSWVVYTMTDSALMLGVTMFASRFPSFLFSLLGGIVSDRYNRYKVLLITQIASMVQAVLLAILVFAGNYTVWEILALSVMLGTINAFDVPARQPLVHEMVKNKDDLPNALALNSSMVNLARLVGPALSGIVLKEFGAATCFILNAASFAAVITSLLLMKLPKYVASPVQKKISTDLVEGFRYIKNTPIIAAILLMLSFISLLVLPYDTLLPVYAKNIFKGDAATFGYINSFIGLGTITGTIFLASLKPGTNLKLILLVNTIILGLGLMLFSHIAYFPVAMLFAAICGFGTMSQTTICNTLLQVHSDKEMRGRVIGFLAMAFFGMMPLGSLLIGAVSQRVGAPNTILGQGTFAVVIALAFSGFLRRAPLNTKEITEIEETEDTIMKEI